MSDRSDADYWRDQAREARARSFARRDLEGRHALLHIAESYDQLAEEAAAGDKTKTSILL